MADQANGVSKAKTARRKTAAKSTAKRKGAGRRAAPRRQATDIGELQRIIAGLEERINQLTSREGISKTVHGATDQVSALVSQASERVGDYVADKVFGVADRVRNGATSVTDVAKVGTGAMQRVGSELEKRPLMTVAIALGIGFLAGLAGRRDAA